MQLVNKAVDWYCEFTTKSFYGNFGLLCSLLESNAECWGINDKYLKAPEAIVNIKVTSDLVERGVKLIKEHNKILKNDDNQKQYLLQIVKIYKSVFPDKNRKVIISLK